MAGKFLRGAFIEFLDTGALPQPNVIVFQFNPEQIVHTWTPAATETEGNLLAVSGNPGESFQFTLKMDGSDMIADGPASARGMAQASGVYSRLAALEMLLHPTDQGPANELIGAVSAAVQSETKSQIPASQLPTVLFVWGPGRILPVRVSSLTITETLYDSAMLNPVQAEASITVDVLTSKEIQYLSGPLAQVAAMSYTASLKNRKSLALANAANSVEAAIGMLPF